MNKTAGSLLADMGRGLRPGTSMNIEGLTMIVPGTFWLPILKDDKLAGFFDAGRFLALHIREGLEPGFHRASGLKSYSPTVPLEELLAGNQSLYPIVDEEHRLQGLLTREEVLEYLYGKTEFRLTELEAIFSSAHNGIVSIDEKGTITSFNPAAERLSMVQKEQALGKYISDADSNAFEH